MRRFHVFVLLAAIAASAAMQAGSPLPARAASGNVQVAIVTNMGTIDVALDPAHAPITVKNFLRLVDRHFYDGGTFFRAIPGFVIQGGNKGRESDRDQPIRLEAPAQTGVHNLDGSIAMARTSDPDSATSEFFIDDGDQPRLDQPPGYAAFGHVTKNMDLVRKIARLPAQDEMLISPVKIIRIQRI